MAKVRDTGRWSLRGQRSGTARSRQPPRSSYWPASRRPKQRLRVCQAAAVAARSGSAWLSAGAGATWARRSAQAGRRAVLKHATSAAQAWSL